MTKKFTCGSKAEKDLLIDYVRDKIYPSKFSKDDKRSLRRRAENFVLVQDELYFRVSEEIRLKVVFDYELTLINQILKSEHEVAHIGAKKLEFIIRQKYYGITKEAIQKYVRSCQACAHFNSLRTIQPLYVNQITKK
ncbi:MAG: integrase zinc binding domain-containing protein, partial [Aeromonas sp.]